MKLYRDHFFLKAKLENYPARSIYKLKELDKKFKLFKKGMKVLDLGAAPGSWSMGASEKIGVQGKVLACDIATTTTILPKNVYYYQSDIFNPTPEFQEALATMGPFQVIMSDMAPQTTGTRFTDQTRSLALCLEAILLAKRHLVVGGAFITKIFMGPDIDDLLQDMRRSFKRVKSFKPQSSRSESKETFFVALDFSPSAEDILARETYFANISNKTEILNTAPSTLI